MAANELFVAIARTYGLHLVLVAVLLSGLCLIRRSLRRSGPGPASCRTCQVAAGHRKSRRAQRLFRAGRRAMAQREHLWW